MVVRLHVSNFSPEITSVELQELFRKLGSVKDVYLPKLTETGLLRNFAIVVMESPSSLEESSLSQSCIRAFNNSFWKGRKIRVAQAREYFLDRLKRESQEELTLLEKKRTLIEAKNELNSKMNFFTGNKVSLRKRKGDQLTICAVPTSEDQNIASVKFGSDEDIENYISSCLERSIKKRAIEIENDVQCCVEKENSIPLKPKAPIPEFSHPSPPPTPLPRAVVNHDGDVSMKNKKKGGIHVGEFSRNTAENIDFRSENMSAMALLRSLSQPKSTLNNLSSNVSATSSESQKAITTPRIEPVSIDAQSSSNSSISNFADLGSLKGIFHKEGGVHWGDTTGDSKLTDNNKAVDSEVSNDTLFLEAEKLGIDIRENQSEKMMFSFFDEMDSTPSNVFQASSGVKIKIPELLPAIGDKSKEIEVEPGNNGNGDEKIDVLLTSRFIQPIVLESVIRTARLFQRKISEEDVRSSWKSSRDKLTLSFKQKRKDARKRSAKMIGNKKRQHLF